jgi:hypothetical protein
MKKTLLSFIAGVALALSIGLYAASSKITGLTNPLAEDLNAAGRWIYNAQAVYTANLFSLGTIFVGDIGYNGIIQLSDVQTANGPAVMAGADDPSLVEQTLVPQGSIYLRRSGELWMKHGPGPLDWHRIAP